MNSNDIIKYSELAFDNSKYYKLQRDAIKDRVQKFSGMSGNNSGRLYLEVGGKFFYDPHAARVLPGFDPKIKQKILADLMGFADIAFCVDWDGIVSDRQLKNVRESYKAVVWEKVKKLQDNFKKRPIIIINKAHEEMHSNVQDFIDEFESKGYKILKRYYIDNYPDDVDKVLSYTGFGRDDYIEYKNPLVIVIGPAASSGKMSTCLGQVFLDSEKGIESGYAMFELFPVWNLPIEHPLNLAYEAATVDIGDFNVWDKYHKRAYDENTVTYNRDAQAFKIILALQKKLDSSNFMMSYKSPTDMCVNKARLAITDDKLVCDAALKEIKRRQLWYRDIINRGLGKKTWVNRCIELERRAEEYIKSVYKEI